MKEVFPTVVNPSPRAVPSPGRMPMNALNPDLNPSPNSNLTGSKDTDGQALLETSFTNKTSVMCTEKKSNFHSLSNSCKGMNGMGNKDNISVALSDNTESTNVGMTSSLYTCNTEDRNARMTSRSIQGSHDEVPELSHNTKDVSVLISSSSHNTCTQDVNIQGAVVGISVPKLDLHKELQTVEQVVVDPDEFNVSLTQEEQNNDKRVNKWQADNDSKEEITHETQRSHFRFRNHDGNVPNTLLGTDDKLTEREHPLSNRNRPQKHKLSSKEVENYFYEFEQTERQFRAIRHGISSPVCSKSKLPRTSDHVHDENIDIGKHDTRMRLGTMVDHNDNIAFSEPKQDVKEDEMEMTVQTQKLDQDQDQVELEHADLFTSIERPECVLTEELDGERGIPNNSDKVKTNDHVLITENPKTNISVNEGIRKPQIRNLNMPESTTICSKAVGFNREPRTTILQT